MRFSQILDPPQFVNVRFQGVVPNIQAQPITVPFGPNNVNIPINDGPSALGYIFTIADCSVLAANRTYANYVLPLHALYSRCTYLAYIRYGANQNLGNVPWMSNSMYFTEHNMLYLLLGSTYVTGVDAASVPKAIMMGNWRRAAILDPALQWYNPPHQLPALAPLYEETIGKGVLKILTGYPLARAGAVLGPLPNTIAALPNPISWVNLPNPVPDGLAAITTAEQQLHNAWNQQHPGPPNLPIATLDRGNIPTCRHFKTDLRTALIGVVRVRWDAAWDPDPAGAHWAQQRQNLRDALARVFAILFTPNMFPADNNGAADATQPPIQTDPHIQPVYQAQSALIFQALYTQQNEQHIIEMLDRFNWWWTHDDPSLVFRASMTKTFGRCAETHPVAALMPNYLPARVTPPGSVVRGFSFQNREMTNARTPGLGINFDSNHLNALHTASNNGLYRRPCRNCQVMLPPLDVPGASLGVNGAYYADMNTMFPTATNLAVVPAD